MGGTKESLVGATSVAHFFSVTVRQIQRLADERKIPAYQVGGVWRFDLDDVKKAMFSSPIPSRVCRTDNTDRPPTVAASPSPRRAMTLEEFKVKLKEIDRRKRTR